MSVTPPASRSEVPVVVVHDHELFGEALVMALRQFDLLARRVPVQTEQDVLHAFTGPLPGGVVLLDLDLGRAWRINGTSMIDLICADRWRILVVTARADRSRIAAAIDAGALGYVDMSTSLETLARTVVAAAEGRQIMSTGERRHWQELHRREQTARAHRAERLGRLGTREQEVLKLLAHGTQVAAIAEKLVVAESTVRSHVKAILRKLEVSSQLKAVAIFRAD